MSEVVPIQPRLLAAHARVLAETTGAGPGDVTPLRRATSAAYYAVFHALALAVARQVTGGADERDLYRLTRALDHGRAATICTWVTDDGAPKRHVGPIVERLRRSRDVVAFGESFLLLQRARHAADYDHLAMVDTAFADAACERAAAALDVLDGLAGTADLRQFLALVALGAALR